jgi:Holliday junction DNA helicase RuvA
LLLAVPNVGPKLALLLMSSLPPAQLAKAVQHGDIPALTRVKGIGKKTAEALLFHLKDRALEIAATASEGLGIASDVERRPAPKDDLMAALLALGYRPAQAEAAATHAREQLPGAELDPLLREALKALR